MGRVEGKVAIVTGGGSGLGAAASAALVREGATVVLTDVNVEGGESTAKEIGSGASFVEHDVTSEEDWVRVVSDTVDRFGRLDVLVNNAGVVVVATIEDTTLEQLRFVEAVNIEGPFLGCKHAIPRMAESGGGSIINLSSTAALMGAPPFAAYSASKGAVRSLTQTVAVHCKQRKNGVRCNSIHPGGMLTPMTMKLRSAIGETSELAMELAGDLAASSIGDPTDIAHAVVYLASDESRFVNGSMLAVDDGLTAA
jgi:3(or 17)beta-hydroxysteroid dehydrogenase